MFLCRGGDIVSYDYEGFRESMRVLSDSDIFIKPLPPLFSRINERLSGFENNNVRNGFLAVDWCLENGMMQQGITLLQEALISAALVEAGMDYRNRLFRTIASSAFKITSQSMPEEKWKGDAAENREDVRRITATPVVQNCFREYDALTQLRNDVNHGGFLDVSRPYDEIERKFILIRKRINELLMNTKSQNDMSTCFTANV